MYNTNNFGVKLSGNCARENCPNVSRPCSIEDHLRMLSASSTTAHTLYNIWGTHKSKLSMMLSLISSPPFQTFSDHGVTHSEMLLSTMARVLGDNLCLLGATDTWMLLECAYRHDLGMYVEYKDVRSAVMSDAFVSKVEALRDDKHDDMKNAACYILNELDNLQKHFAGNGDIAGIPSGMYTYNLVMVLSSYFRSGHADRSRKLILDEMENASNHVIPMRLWRLIADICAGHSGGRGVEYTLTHPYKQVGICNDELHPRLVQVLLRLADTLDVDNNRFNGWQLAQWWMDNLPQETKAHMLKHNALEHLHLDSRTVSLKARMDYSTPPKNDLESVMSDDEFYMLTRNMEEQFRHTGLRVNEIVRQLKKGNKNMMLKLQEMEERRKESYEASREKREASRLVRRYMKEIEEELDCLALNWQVIVPDCFHGSAPKFDKDKSEIWWRTKKLDEEIVDLEYSISHNRASELMRGASLYGDKNFLEQPIAVKHYHHMIFLREFVSNSMDAMKIQLYRYINENKSAYNELSYKDSIRWSIFDVLKNDISLSSVLIQVRYRISDDALILNICDNGCGIDKTTMKSMKNIGGKKSQKVLSEVQRMPEWLKPNGSFGIGMQSVYAVADYYTGISQTHHERKKYEMIFENKDDGASLFAEELLASDQTDKSRFKAHGLGTMFRVEISRERAIKERMFAGITPFDYNVESVFKEVAERIDLFLGRDIFPVEVKFYIDEVEVTLRNGISKKSAFDEIIRHYKDYKKPPQSNQECELHPVKECSFVPPYHDDSHAFTCFNSTSKDSMSRHTVILSYNKKHNMLVRIKFVGGDETSTKYYYRGLYVPEVEEAGMLRYPGCDLEISHWGGNAEDILLVSRNKFTLEARKQVHLAVIETVDVALTHYINYLTTTCDKWLNTNPCTVWPYNTLSDSESSGLAEALTHYRMHVSENKTTTYDTDSCHKVINTLAKNGKLNGKHGVFSFNGERLKYELYPDADVFNLSLEKLWYVDNTVIARTRHALSTSFEVNINEPGETIISTDHVIATDKHLRSFYKTFERMPVAKLQLCKVQPNSADETLYWLFQLAENFTEYIDAGKATEKRLKDEAMRSINSINPKINASYPLSKISKERIVMPGFACFKLLNVTSLPPIADDDYYYDESIFSNLGNYFIWPFSNEQVRGIARWYNKYKDTKQLERHDIKALKLCPDIADALNPSSKTFKSLVSHVAMHLSAGTHHYTQNGNLSGLETDIRNRYEDIIVTQLWPMIKDAVDRQLIKLITP
ncbi:MAG: hypothetical protein FWC32_05460 [Firmicutes bacterium]|nr:hypothetical protein [Bacillota bacterium]